MLKKMLPLYMAWTGHTTAIYCTVQVSPGTVLCCMHTDQMGGDTNPNPYHNQPLLKVQLPGCAWTLFINVISIFHSFRYSKSIKAMFMFYKVQLISLPEHSKGFLATAHLQAALNTVELTHLKLWIWSISQLWLQFNFSSTSVEDLFLCTFNI